jgi:hypothetical protein
MEDFEAFQKALASHTRDNDGEPNYMDSLMNSMSLVLDEFYKHLKVIILEKRSLHSTDIATFEGCRRLIDDRRWRSRVFRGCRACENGI